MGTFRKMIEAFLRDANGHHNGPGYVSRKVVTQKDVPTVPVVRKKDSAAEEFLINRRTGDMIPVVPGTERTLKDVIREIEESKTWIKGQMELSRDYSPSPSDVDDRHPDDYRLKDAPRDDANDERVTELINDLRDAGEKVRTGDGKSMPIVLPPSEGMKPPTDSYNLRLLYLAFEAVFMNEVDEARTWIKQMSPGAAERMYRSLNVMMAELLAKDAADNLKNYK
jgi:hypothetical protein